MTSQKTETPVVLADDIVKVAQTIRTNGSRFQKESWKTMVDLFQVQGFGKKQALAFGTLAGLPNQVVLMGRLVAMGLVMEPTLVTVPCWEGIKTAYKAQSAGVDVSLLTLANCEDVAKKAMADQKAKNADPVKDLEKGTEKFLDLLRACSDELPGIFKRSIELKQITAMLLLSNEGKRAGVSLGANPRSKNSPHRSGSAPRRQPQHGAKPPPDMKVGVPAVTITPSN